MERLVLPSIRREALLPSVIEDSWCEATDPPIEIVDQMKIHDLLLFIAYLREQGIIFESVDELRDQMPNLHRTADDIAKIRLYMKRWSYCTGCFNKEARHRPNLVITHRHRYRGRETSYKFTQGPEVVIAVRRLYREGYSLDKKVFDTELRGLSSSLSASLKNTCDAVDFDYVPSGIPTNDISFHRAILACGIDATIAFEEGREHRSRLLRMVMKIVDSDSIVPTELVKELRKHISSGALPEAARDEFRMEIVFAIHDLLGGEDRFRRKYGDWSGTRYYKNDWYDHDGLKDIGGENF